ncbi:hypothetical protein GCM10022226_35800 [Sphaerisporangium flaviroseum]|uniref:Uncharacterized protein n=1 Tax=Sphaerisporangium flaviroseum TaxID=509199 RepID=A0ABP7I868_9ACTN
MTESPDEYGEVLRRVLRAEASSVMPSAEGLEIIRTRIDQRGVRGMFWWKAAASAFGAVLVAATVVMAIPGLRQHLDPSPQPIMPVQFDTSPPDESSTRRPQNNLQPPVGSQIPQPSLSVTPTPFPTSQSTATTSPGTDCATPAPTSGSALPCPSPSSSDPQADQTTRPGPRPTPTPTAKPTVQPTHSPKPPTPTAEPTTSPCQQCSPAPTETTPPTVTPQMTTQAETTAPQP